MSDSSDPGPPLSGLLRPDGRLQLGLGPGAWLVQGWQPETASAHDPATALVRALGAVPALPTAPPRRAESWSVLGEGEIADRLRRSSTPLSAHTSQRPMPRPELVVLVSSYVVPIGTARDPALEGRRVLPVVPQTGRVVVGPWTGLSGGPCLHCLDLHRRDHDAAWPQLAALLDDPLRAAPPAHGEPLLAVVHALVMLLLEAAAGGVSPAPAVGYEVGPSAPHLVTRRWPAHPICPWHRPGGP